MKRVVLVALAVGVLAVLTGCNKCPDVPREQAYGVKIESTIKVAQIDPATGAVVGHSSLQAGTEVVVYGPGGLKQGKSLDITSGMIVMMMDSTGTTSYQAETGVGSTITMEQAMNFAMCLPMVSECMTVGGSATGSGTAGGGLPVNVGAVITICWPNAVSEPAPGTSYNVPVGTPITWRNPDGPTQAGILETPIMIVVN
jgi:hypothetical protein